MNIPCSQMVIYLLFRLLKSDFYRKNKKSKAKPLLRF